jgi:MYXO-CTERM domain-containing protein
MRSFAVYTDRRLPPRTAGVWPLVWIAVPLLLLLLAAAHPASAQVAFSSASANTGRIASGWDHTVPAGGQGRYLLFGVSIESSVDAPTVMSATYAGLPLTRLGFADLAGTGRIEIWGLANPPEGTNLASVRLTANAFFTAGAASFTGVDQASSTGLFTTAMGSSGGAAINVSSAAGDRVFTVYASDTDPISLDADSPQQRHWFIIRGAGGSSPGGSGDPVRWTANPSQTWLLAGLAVKAPVSAGTDAGSDTAVADSNGPPADALPDTAGPDAATPPADASGSTDGVPPRDTGGVSDAGTPSADGSIPSGGSDGLAAGRDSAHPDEDNIAVRDIDVRVGCACRHGPEGRAGVATPSLLALLAAALRRRSRVPSQARARPAVRG